MFVSVPIPKCASTSVAEALGTYRLVDRKQHVRCSRMREFIEGSERWRGAEIIAVVRNPFDRMESAFRWRTRHKHEDQASGWGGFDGFVREILKNRFYGPSQSWWLDAEPDHILMFEQLRHEFHELTGLRLPHRNGTKTVGASRPAWSVEAIETVRAAWGEDFERFGYDPGMV